MTTGPRCGTPQGYRDHHDNGTDRCRACKDAQAAWQRAYVISRYTTGPRLIDPTGTARRIQALQAIGWPLRVLGDRIGVTGRNMYRISSAGKVHRDTARKVAVLYDELSMTLGPSVRAKQMARRAGWAPPLAWSDETIDDPKARPDRGWTVQKTANQPIDEIAVQRAMRGEAVKLRPVERAEAVYRLTTLGLSAAQIADRLHIDERSVYRHKKAAA